MKTNLTLEKINEIVDQNNLSESIVNSLLPKINNSSINNLYYNKVLPDY